VFKEGLDVRIIDASVGVEVRGGEAGGRMRFTALSALINAGFWGLMLFSGAVEPMFAALFGLAGLGLIWLGPAAADVHELVGPQRRGLGVAVYYLVVNVIGRARRIDSQLSTLEVNNMSASSLMVSS
jgi:hypothetical protein